MRISGILHYLKVRARQIKEELYTLYLAYRDPRVPWPVKAFTACVVAYALSPLDLIPDFIPVLGYLDDLVLLPLGIWLALKMIPPQILAECRQKARPIRDGGNPMRFPGVAVVLILWGVVAVAVLVCIFRTG